MSQSQHPQLSAILLVETALHQGWRAAKPHKPQQPFHAVVHLSLADQVIPVSMLVKATLGTDPMAAAARAIADFETSEFLEHFVFLRGFTGNEARILRAQAELCVTRKLAAGTALDYQDWLKERLGPVRKMSVNSPVRRVVEPLLRCQSGFPQAYFTIDKEVVKGKLANSFALGDKGVLALTTILEHFGNAGSVKNVEGEPAWRDKDVDMLVKPCGEPGEVRVEVKTEDYISGNFSLELNGNFEAGKQGWYHYCEADILVSVMWPNGEVLIQDLAQVRQWLPTAGQPEPVDLAQLPTWVTSRGESIRLSKGSAPEGDTQRTHGLVLLPTMKAALKAVPDAVYLRLESWLPGLFGVDDLKNPTIKNCEEKRLLPTVLGIAR